MSRACALARLSTGTPEASAGLFRNYLVSSDGTVEMRSTWTVITRLPATAHVIASVLGGEPLTRRAGEPGALVATAAARVGIIIDAVDSVRFDMKQWIDGTLTHHCDTRVFLSPEEKEGLPCGCPASMADLKSRATANRGPRPDIRIRFRLVLAPGLGGFEYRTRGWTLLTDRAYNLHCLLERLARGNGPSRCSLEIEPVEYTTKLGRRVGFHRVRLRTVEASEPGP